MTQKYLKEILFYNEKEGCLYWIKKLSNAVKIGDKAGCYTGRYVSISINNKKYLAHHLIWLYVYGKFPKHQIDHIDQDTKNNKISNLRDVSSKINSRNKPKRRDNKSGVTGVSFDSYTNKWVVRIKDDYGKYRNRGRFDTIDQAKQARNKAIIEFGYSKEHGEKYSKNKYREK